VVTNFEGGKELQTSTRNSSIGQWGRRLLYGRRKECFRADDQLPRGKNSGCSRKKVSVSIQQLATEEDLGEQRLRKRSWYGRHHYSQVPDSCQRKKRVKKRRRGWVIIPTVGESGVRGKDVVFAGVGIGGAGPSTPSELSLLGVGGKRKEQDPSALLN